MTKLMILVAMMIALILSCSKDALAQQPPEGGDLATAKEAFSRGVELTRQEKWGEALDAFEAAERAKKHAMTTYNIAIAERALSRYTRARVRFISALEQDDASGGKELAGSRDATKTFVQEIDAVLVHVDVKLDPADASLMVDGRPLVWPSKQNPVAFAGVAQAGAGERVDRASFEILIDPGVHVFTVTKSGFDTVAKKEDFKAGSRPKVALSLTAMPGALRVDANQKGSAIRIDDIDVGVAPVLVDRPAGDYRIDVRKSGFVTYATKVTLLPGQRTDIFAKMAEDPPLTRRWWFWTALGTAVAAGVVTAVLLTSGSAKEYNGGTTGWVATPQ